MIGDEEEAVRALGDRIGFGRLMQLAEQTWREASGHPGSEHTTGPCAVFMVPCPCREAGESSCDWCCGAGRVTRRVRDAMDGKLRIEAPHVWEIEAVARGRIVEGSAEAVEVDLIDRLAAALHVRAGSTFDELLEMVRGMRAHTMGEDMRALEHVREAITEQLQDLTHDLRHLHDRVQPEDGIADVVKTCGASDRIAAWLDRVDAGKVLTCCCCEAEADRVTPAGDVVCAEHDECPVFEGGDSIPPQPIRRKL